MTTAKELEDAVRALPAGGFEVRVLSDSLALILYDRGGLPVTVVRLSPAQARHMASLLTVGAAKLDG